MGRAAQVIIGCPLKYKIRSTLTRVGIAFVLVVLLSYVAWMLAYYVLEQLFGALMSH